MQWHSWLYQNKVKVPATFNNLKSADVRNQVWIGSDHLFANFKLTWDNRPLFFQIDCVCSSHQVQYNIPTFEALLRKNVYLFLEWCRKSSNVWLRALTQFVYIRPYSLNTTTAFYSCDWVLGHCSACSFEGVSCRTAHSYFSWPRLV